MKLFQIHIIAFLFLVGGSVFADGFDTLSYKEKFNITVQQYQEGRYKLAASNFQSVLENNNSFKDPSSQLMLAKSQYHLGEYTLALQSVRSVINQYPDSPYTVHAKLLMGDISLAHGFPSKAFEMYLEIRPTITDTIFLSEVDSRILATVGLGLKEDRVEGYFFSESNQQNRAILNIVRAYISWKRGDEYDLTNALNGILDQDVPSAYKQIYSRLLESKNKQLISQNTIAVMLPLSGFDQQNGLAYLLGLSDFIEGLDGLNSIRFLVFDTQGDAFKTLSVVKQLALEQSVFCVLGPLSESEIIALAGLQISLPILIPKSSPDGMSNLSPNIFSLSPSDETLARRTAQLMVNEYGLETIAVISPGDIESARNTHQFLEELFQLGVDPVAVEWYHEKPENISRQFKPIRKLAWDLIPEENPDKDVLHLSIDSLDALFDVDVDDFFDLPEEEKMTKKDSSKVTLETIHALYLPIRKNELTYIGTQLPMYNLKTMIFGNANWLNMDELNQDVIGPHVQGLKLISPIHSNHLRSIDDAFDLHYNYASDHATFIQSILGTRVMNRRLFLEKLKSHPGYNGEFSSIQFLGNNRNENGLVHVIQYEGKSVQTLGVYNGNTLSKETE